MNRRQKIIVSITGIFIVLLALVGLTYAYFLTQIKGNTNSTSVTLSTANLLLEYTDGNGELRAANKLTPDTDILFNKMTVDEDGNPTVELDSDGNPVVVNSKTFSVENKGNEDVENYAVTVENYSLTYVTSGKDSEGNDVVAGAETTFKYPETLVVNVTCTSNKGTCNGVENGTFPENNDILLYNDIEVGEKHEYTLTMKYIDNGENQSADMNKTLSAQINIIDANNTVDLTGEVASYTLGDYVQINSEPKTSRIVKGKDGKYTYKLVGVQPDDHELGVYNKSNTETPKGSSELSIVKGKVASVVGNVITITDASREVNVDITSTYSTTVGSMKSGLKDLIIANAKVQKNGTLLVDEPASTPTNWEYGSLEKEYLYLQNYNYNGISYAAENPNDMYACMGGTDGDCSKAISNPKTCEEVKGKYILVGPQELFIEDCENGKYVLGEVKYEKTLVNHNEEYYYRGMVNDNYLNYNGMCWKIVSIQNDGSIKMVLEDQYDNCNETTDSDNDGKTYTGNWAIGEGHYGCLEKNGYCSIDYLNNNVLQDNSMKFILDNWFETNNFKTDNLKKEIWDIISSSSNTLESYIYTLDIYDSLNAGSFDMTWNGGYGEVQSLNYLTNDFSVNNLVFTAIVPRDGQVMVLDGIGAVSVYFPNDITIDMIESELFFIRPVLVLKNGIVASGEGIITNPYVVE